MSPLITTASGAWAATWPTNRRRFRSSTKLRWMSESHAMRNVPRLSEPPSSALDTAGPQYANRTLTRPAAPEPASHERRFHAVPDLRRSVEPPFDVGEGITLLARRIERLPLLWNIL